MTLHSKLLSRDTEPGDATSTAILDHLGLPIFLVGCDSAIVYANTAARALLDGDGLVKAVNSILSTSHVGDGERLRDAIIDICANGAGRVVVLGRESHLQPLVALVLPFHIESEQSQRGQALVLLRGSQGQSELLANSLRQLFRLSPAEASIAVALGTGMGLTELAQQRKVKLNTLRSQVASIMAKTSTRRQAQLVALVSRIDSVL